MAISSALEMILSKKRAHPYSDKQSIEDLRAEHRAAGAAIPLPDGTVCEAVDAGGVPAEWISLESPREENVFLFIHGGAYYRGSAAATRATAARISAAAGMRCLSINYRLAPEHVFPAAIDDTFTSYKWLLEQGVTHDKIIVGGISAGGGLALALLLKLKETCQPQPAGAVPMSAWTDLTQSGESMHANAGSDPFICKAYLDRMARQYLDGVEPRTALASPLFGELSGLPPMLIQVGTAESMFDDSQRFADRAYVAGVEIEFEPWDDMFHGWHGSAHVLEDAQKAIDSIGRFCRKIL